MKRETWLLTLGATVALSIFCGLFLLIAEHPIVTTEPVGQSLSLAQAPLSVIVLVGLAVLVSGGLLLAPFFQNKA